MAVEGPIRPFCGCYLQDCKQVVNAIIVWSIIFKTQDAVLKKPNPNACICAVWENHWMVSFFLPHILSTAIIYYRAPKYTEKKCTLVQSGGNVVAAMYEHAVKYAKTWD